MGPLVPERCATVVGYILLANVSLRFGLNNVFDAEPPLADADVGYQRGAGTNPRGRAFYSQISKRF